MNKNIDEELSRICHILVGKQLVDIPVNWVHNKIWLSFEDDIGNDYSLCIELRDGKMHINLENYINRLYIEDGFVLFPQ